MLRAIQGIALALALVLIRAPSWAATERINIARQFGLSDFPLMIVEHEHLLEKHAKALGLEDVSVGWVMQANSSAMVDALLSGSVDVMQSGIPALLTLWSKTSGARQVKAICALDRFPVLLITNQARIKTLRDFQPTDRIALPGVRISYQAILLSMAAAKTLGPGHQADLDQLTVTLAHSDAIGALLSGRSEVTAEFSAPPYQATALQDPRIHVVMSSYDLTGPMTAGILMATTGFESEHKKLIAALRDAVAEAMAIINKDKTEAARTYVELSHDKTPASVLAASLQEMDYNMRPRAITPMIAFMAESGMIARKPSSLHELFLPGADVAEER